MCIDYLYTDVTFYTTKEYNQDIFTQSQLFQIREVLL